MNSEKFLILIEQWSMEFPYPTNFFFLAEKCLPSSKMSVIVFWFDYL